MKKSYRYVWSRIQEAESALGESLVESQVGGHGTQRSKLTAKALQLTSEFSAMRRRLIDVLEKEFSARLVLDHFAT